MVKARRLLLLRYTDPLS